MVSRLYKYPEHIAGASASVAARQRTQAPRPAPTHAHTTVQRTWARCMPVRLSVQRDELLWLRLWSTYAGLDGRNAARGYWRM